MANQRSQLQGVDEDANEGVLGATLERVYRRHPHEQGVSRPRHPKNGGEELPPVVLIGESPLKRVSVIGLKLVVVPDQQLLDLWQQKVLELQVLQRLRRCMPQRA